MYKRILMTGVCFAMTPQISLAQDTAEPEVQDQRRLTTVTVTAQKRAQDIQDVPISISAYGAEFIEESGVETLTDIALYSPNFSISQSSQKTNQRIIIRGVGSVGNNAIEPSVGVFIDGVYYPRSGSVVGNLIDLEAVEVLRGPQGTLFGRNTPMGALNIRTKSASRDGLESSLDLGFGSYDAFTLGGSVSAPINDAVAFRLSGKYNERGGFGDNLFTGEEFGAQDDFNLRGKLDFDFAPNFNVVVSADYGEVNSDGTTIEFLNGTESPQFLGTIGALFGPDATNLVTSDPFDHDIYQDHRDTLADEQWGLSVDAEYELGSGHTIKSITSYREWDADVFESALRLPAQLFPRKTTYATETFSQEFQLLSPEGETFEYVAGLFFYDESYYIDQDFDFGAQFCIPVVAGLAGLPAAQGCAVAPQIDVSDSEFNQDLQSVAAYGQGTWHVNDAWSLTLGGRYTTDDKTGDFTNAINNPFVVALSIRAPDSQLGLDAGDYGDTDAFTFFANASYFPADDIMLFGTVSSGFKSGGFNSEGVFPALTREQRGFGPETTTNYELGIKSQLFDNTLQLNATLFRMDIEDFQDRAFDGISFITRNAGELRQQGLETDFVWAPLDQLTFTGGLSYLDSEFQDYQNASPLPGGLPQDLTGQSAHFSPEWQGSLVADWSDDLTFWNGTEYFLRGETQYMGEHNAGGNTNQNPQTIQEAYQLFNARVGVRAHDGAWEVSAFGRNLGDEGYCRAIFAQPFGGQLGATNANNNTTAMRCAVGDPLTWGLQLKLKR